MPVKNFVDTTNMLLNVLQTVDAMLFVVGIHTVMLLTLTNYCYASSDKVHPFNKRSLDISLFYKFN